MYRTLEEGEYSVNRHPIKRVIERYGDNYIGNKKIKNMSWKKIRSIIINQLTNKIQSTNILNIMDVEVKTKLFRMLVTLDSKNKVKTILPETNENDPGELSYKISEVIKSDKFRD